jgi:HlyD family secretion protein
MTATANIVISDRQDVLTVPDAALRYSPPAPPKDRPASSPLWPMQAPRMSRRSGEAPGGGRGGGGLGPSQAALWVLEGGVPKRVVVEIGGSDGQFTEVASGPIKPGTQVITDQEQPKPQ